MPATECLSFDSWRAVPCCYAEGDVDVMTPIISSRSCALSLAVGFLLASAYTHTLLLDVVSSYKEEVALALSVTVR